MTNARPMPPVPELLTPRLRLRGHRAEDLADCLAMWSDPEVTRYIGGRPFTEEEVWARILRYVGHWVVMGYGYWAIEERASGRFVGEAGMADVHRAIETRWRGVPEVGWALAPWAQGRGLATEAVLAVLEWADAVLPGRRTVCMIEPGHDGSWRVAEKCGFRPYARTQYAGLEIALLERYADGSST